jgi:EmrB/QacA subfamily drug resistance transporter
MTDPTRVESAEARIHRQRWLILSLLCMSLLIVVIGNTTLNVLLPTLSKDLGATESQLQWVVAIYSLVFAGLLFTTGALGDRFGRKGALQLGLLIFLAGSVLAAVSSDMTQLIICRGLMGVGASLIMPSTLSILINVFPPHERPKAIAIWASIAGGGGSFGPIIGGALLTRFWWGSVFLVNVPIIVIALIAGVVLMPTSRDPHESPLDPLGAVLSTLGIVAIVYSLIEAPEKGWLSSATVVAAVAGLVFLALFVMWERRTAQPMLDISYFRNRAFSTATGGMILVFMTMFGVFFLIIQYFQQVLGMSPLSASFRLIPTGVCILLVAPFTPRFSAILGANRAVALGMTLIAAGMTSFYWITPHSSYWQILVGLVPISVGISMTSSPMTSAIMSAVPTNRAGSGSSMNDATRELGAALGIAVLGSIAASHYSSSIGSAIRGLDGGGRSAATGSLAGALDQASRLPAAAGRTLAAAARQSFVEGIHIAALVGGAAALISAGLVLRYLPKVVMHKGAMHSALESLESTAELTIGGVMPLAADDLAADDLASDGRPA